MDYAFFFVSLALRACWCCSDTWRLFLIIAQRLLLANRLFECAVIFWSSSPLLSLGTLGNLYGKPLGGDDYAVLPLR